MLAKEVTITAHYNMNDPGWAWPAWKFGLKMDEEFKQLHEQYNTFPSTIQDPQAFHRDLLRTAVTATTKEEFYEELAIRKEMRILELNTMLESLSDEIVANPSLVAAAQWHHAVQIFRTGSLDSLVGYFASYLDSNDTTLAAKTPALE